MGSSATALIAAGSIFMIALWIFLVLYLCKAKCSKVNKNTSPTRSDLQTSNEHNGVESCQVTSVTSSSIEDAGTYESQPPPYYICVRDLGMVGIFVKKQNRLIKFFCTKDLLFDANVGFKHTWC